MLLAYVLRLRCLTLVGECNQVCYSQSNYLEVEKFLSINPPIPNRRDYIQLQDQAVAVSEVGNGWYKPVEVRCELSLTAITGAFAVLTKDFSTRDPFPTTKTPMLLFRPFGYEVLAFCISWSHSTVMTDILFIEPATYLQMTSPQSVHRFFEHNT